MIEGVFSFYSKLTTKCIKNLRLRPTLNTFLRFVSNVAENLNEANRLI